jgi:hypothetical protein
VPTFAETGCHVVSMTDPYGRILGFLDRSRYFFFQVAPQLYSRGKELVKISLATRIVTYQPQVELQSLSMEKHVSSTEGTMLVVISWDKTDENISVTVLKKVW